MAENVEHRLLRAHEMPAALDLWARTFEVEPAFFTTLIEASDDGGNATYGTFVDGSLVSTVHVFTRWLYDERGGVAKVGGIGSVATEEAHRRNGYSGTLIEIAIKAMTQDGFDWSLLFTGVNAHYERYGWETMSTYAWTGLPAPASGQTSRASIEAASADEMAEVFAASQLGRPVTQRRNERTWKTAIPYRIRNATLLVVRDGPKLLGYAFLNERDDEPNVIEACALPEVQEEVLTELFQAAAERVRASGKGKVWATVPRDEPYATAVRELIAEPTLHEGRFAMARPIAPEYDIQRLRAMFADERARHWPLDNF